MTTTTELTRTVARRLTTAAFDHTRTDLTVTGVMRAIDRPDSGHVHTHRVPAPRWAVWCIAIGLVLMATPFAVWFGVTFVAGALDVLLAR